MGKKTSVDLTDVVLPLKEKYQPIYGLKNILSAGVLLFDRIPQHLRERIIGIANGVDEQVGDISEPEEVSSAMDTAFVHYRLLSPAESESFDRLCALLGPDELEQALKNAVAARQPDTPAARIVADAHRKSARKKAARKGTASRKSARSSQSAG